MIGKGDFANSLNGSDRLLGAGACRKVRISCLGLGIKSQGFGSFGVRAFREHVLSLRYQLLR